MLTRSLTHGAAWALVVTACNQGQATDTAATEATTSTSTSTSTSSTDTTTPTSTTTPTMAMTDGLPPTPTLVSPADGATDVPLETALCWNLVEDPDGEQLRYRVFVNDAELTEGELGDFYGYDGPCVGPLTFAFERSYSWRVQAFEVDDPARSSPMSETWTFATLRDGVTETVFADNFDDDLGWEILGDAASGAWVRGDPVLALDAGELSQPDRCLGGASCFFTGQNPDGLADQQDVAGGSTDAAPRRPSTSAARSAATVQLGRFFYRSDPGAGPQLAVELLVPREDAPGEYDAHPLELLATPTAGAPENLWWPREYAVCGPPLTDGSRLRISATDAGYGAARGRDRFGEGPRPRRHHRLRRGRGRRMRPQRGASARVQGDLLCCSQGVHQRGDLQLRGAGARPRLRRAAADRGRARQRPAGVRRPRSHRRQPVDRPHLHQIMVSNDTCELFEGCVGGPRRAPS
jgi:hypothetical protein